MKTLFIIIISVFLLSFIPTEKKQYAKCTSYEQADSVQNYFNNALKIFIADYRADRWCNPIENKCKAEWYVELGEGKRNEIILFFLPKNIPIVEIEFSDTCVFLKPKPFPIN